MRKTDVWCEMAARKMPKMLADKLEPFPIRQFLTALVHSVASMVAFMGSM